MANKTIQRLYNFYKKLILKFTRKFIKQKSVDFKSFNWADHQFEPVLCKITPRKTYNGCEVKPEVAACTGYIAMLIYLWEQEPMDKYPGEYALGPWISNKDILGSKITFERMGIGWISSHDVTILEIPNGILKDVY